jgi:hypothetical protein
MLNTHMQMGNGIQYVRKDLVENKILMLHLRMEKGHFTSGRRIHSVKCCLQERQQGCVWKIEKFMPRVGIFNQNFTSRFFGIPDFEARRSS